MSLRRRIERLERRTASRGFCPVCIGWTEADAVEYIRRELERGRPGPEGCPGCGKSWPLNVMLAAMATGRDDRELGHP